MEDDRLRLIFTCCHPALSTEAQVALTLRLLGGLSTRQVASAFLVTEQTMARRLVRAKRKIKAARIPYRVPLAHELPDEPGVAGLLALLLLTESRRASRVRPDGSLVLLGEQDRTRWDRALITEGQVIVRCCLGRNQPGPYQLQAAINAVHADAATIEQTDWPQIVALYDQLLVVAPTPVIVLNRAIAIGEAQGPAVALLLVDELALDNYYPFYATRADLLRAAGPQQRGGGRLSACGRHGAERGRAGVPQAWWPGFALSEPATSSRWRRSACRTVAPQRSHD